jgi:flagellar assembly protein FliH
MTGFVPLQAPRSGFRPLRAQPAAGFAPLWRGAVVPEPTPAPAPEIPPGADPAPAPSPEPDTGEELDVAALRAREDGYRDGLAAGRADAEAELAARLQSLDALAAALDSARARRSAALAPDIADAVTAIARALVGRELAVDSSGVERLVAGILDDLAAADTLLVRVSPRDEALLGAAAPRLLDRLGRDRSLRIQADPSLSAGGAVIETSCGDVDATVETRFRAFADAVAAWASDEGIREGEAADAR